MFDSRKIELMFESYKEAMEFEEFRKEREENHRILCSQPFDECKAREQISKLVNKYSLEINAMAIQRGNGKTVTNQPIPKTTQEIWDDLNYLNRNIALFALERKGITHLLQEAMKRVLSNGM